MKKTIKISLIALLVLVVSGATQAATVIDFDAVALRPADDCSGYGTITEFANQNGVSVSTPKAGQKLYYGTDFFNGTLLSNMGYIQFTYTKPVDSPGSTPYINIVVQNGTGSYAVVAPLTVNEISKSTSNNIITTTVKYDLATNTSFGFYEAVGTPLPVLADVAGWSLLGAGSTRPLSSGEINHAVQPGVARASLTDGLSILWGDSAANYIGDRTIYDVSVSANGGQEYVAGVPEPATMAILGLGALMCRKFKKA